MPPLLPTSPHLIHSPAISIVVSSSHRCHPPLPSPLILVALLPHLLVVVAAPSRALCHYPGALLCHRDPHTATFLSSLPLPLARPRLHIATTASLKPLPVAPTASATQLFPISPDAALIAIVATFFLSYHYCYLAATASHYRSPPTHSHLSFAAAFFLPCHYH
ncbi:hypothetical protein B296_00016915 [Ensete ventricosum]|uniref:Uncharacterized protein n=1 Tax=Ensete ventricosum TaxID=4639 RepID=A0A426ZW41_ENSVE|nr:hypothetical protein B296_00016915 [Ensete ventricosum]